MISPIIYFSAKQLCPRVRLRKHHIWYFLYLNSFGKIYRFNDIANYDILSCNEIKCNTMQHNVIQWNVMQRNATQFNKMQYNIKQNHSITCNNNTILRHLRIANPIYRMVSSISYLIFTTTRSWRPSCNAMIYNEIQCNTMQYSVIQ